MLELAVSDASLDEQIRGFGSLVSLALALVVVFTNQRSEALQRRPAEMTSPTKWKLLKAAGLDLGLLALTVLLALAAAPLFIEALGELGFLTVDGAVTSAFAVVWLGLLVLVAWQISVLARTFGQTKKLDS